MKLIFLDIDGTLTVPGENIPPESAVEAIERVRARGHKIFLCTGRNPDMLKPLLKYQFDGFISCSGGYVAVGEKYDKVLYDKPMTDEQREMILQILHHNGVFCTVEAKGGSWGDENLGDFLNSQGEGNSEIERWRKALSSNLGIRPMSEYDGSPVYKVVIMCLEMSQLNEAIEKLSGEFNFVLQEVKAPAKCINGEIFSKEFNKGTGVKLICEHFNHPIEDTIGFGDSMNDLEMMQTVGYSVCMANGAEKLKELADMVAPAVSEDGLARAFTRLKLT